MSERKIVQINSHTMEPKGCNYLVSYTVALCDDGSLWELARAQGDHAWTRLPDIPQEQPAPPAPLSVLRELSDAECMKVVNALAKYCECVNGEDSVKVFRLPWGQCHEDAMVHVIRRAIAAEGR